MALKLFRCFFGGYTPNYMKLAEREYKIMPNIGTRLITVLNNDQGFGMVKGTVKTQGVNSANISVCIFKRSNRTMLWETKSKADGSYSFRNIAIGMECFVVAFDPNRQYNAVISDMITTVDGRL